MKIHTDTHTRHSQLGNTSLEERSIKVAGQYALGFLQEAVGLVGIGEVGTCTNHIRHLLGKNSKTCGTCGTRSGAFLLYTLAPVYLRSIAAEPLLQQGSLFGIILCPHSLLCLAVCNNLT